MMRGLGYQSHHFAPGTSGGATLNFNFLNDGLDPRITFTRASNATQFNSAGTLVYAPNNWIRNNTMQGAVAGTPGTPPTNWSSSSAGGVSREVVGTGTSNGINYIDIRVFGTTTNTNLALNLYFELATQIAALTGQTWSESVWVQMVGGSTAGIGQIYLAMVEISSGGADLAYLTGTDFKSTIGTFTRRTYTVTTSNASTAFIRPALWVSHTGIGAAIDITLRIGLPQLEIGPTANAVIPTSGTAYQGPRLDFNPATLAAQGLLIEEQRTNSIRNNTMQGAVVGTPGTLPTNWQIAGAGTGTLTREIVGTGVINGITYIDIKFTGTISTSGFNIACEPSIGCPAASAGQTWTNSNYVAIVGGDTTNITAIRAVGVIARTSGGASVGADAFDSGDNKASLTSTLQRFSASRTLTDGTTAGLQPGVVISLGTGTIGDPTNGITLRIGLPQLEQGAFATSVIPTTTTALTRSADVASVNTLSPWFNATEGTLFAEWTAQAFTHRPATFNDGTQSNAIALVASATNIGSNVYVSNVFQGTAGVSGTFTTGTTYKQATAYKLNDTQDFANGVAATTDTTISIPTVTQLLLGAGRNGMASTPGNGWLRRFTYYPRRLSQAEGIAITA